MREKYFNRHQYDKELTLLENKLQSYNLFLSKANEIKKGATTLEDVQKYLNGKTKFVNSTLSADALGLKEEYLELLNLESLWVGLNLNALDKVSGDVLPERYKTNSKYLDELKEQHTVYYTPFQEKQIDTIEKALAILNKLELPFRESFAYNRMDKTWHWTKQHTDNNLLRR